MQCVNERSYTLVFGLTFPNHLYLGSELGVNVFGANHTSFPHAITTENAVSLDFNDETSDWNLFSTNRTLSLKTAVKRNTVEPFLDIKFGFLSTPTALLYLRGGINYNEFKLKQRINFTAEGSGIDVTEDESISNAETEFTFHSHKSKSRVGYRVGAGTEFLVTPEMGIGVDYIYSFNPRMKTSISGHGTNIICDIIDGCFSVPADFTATSKTTVNDQQVQAQVIYHFA